MNRPATSNDIIGPRDRTSATQVSTATCLELQCYEFQDCRLLFTFVLVKRYFTEYENSHADIEG